MSKFHTCFCTFGANLRAQSVFINKISASELSRKLIKSALLVGWQLLTTDITIIDIGGYCAHVFQLAVEFHGVTSSRFAPYHTIVRGLYLRGFRQISWEPNLVAASPGRKGHSPMFEVTFRRRKEGEVGPC